MTLLTVLRSGGEYTAAHVERLRAQIGKTQMHTISDVPCRNRIPARYRYPGWWAKMELFRPDIQGHVLYLDLDSTVVGDLSPFTGLSRSTILSDFYRPENMQSSMMFLRQEDRARIWAAWHGNEQAIIESYRTRRVGFNGDQNFIQDVCERDGIAMQRFQNVLPFHVISYKCDIMRHTQPHTRWQDTWRKTHHRARVVIFHGRPRPWQTDELES